MNLPTFAPVAERMLAAIAVTDPFPLLPVTWIERNAFCGLPIPSRRPRIVSRPGRIPNRRRSASRATARA